LHFTCHTHATIAVVSGRASIPIIASSIVVEVGTTLTRLTHIVGTGIRIVATLQTVERAESTAAVVPMGTLVAVVAIGGIDSVRTALPGVAGIVSAGIAIITVLWVSRLTYSFCTAIAGGTEIIVAAGGGVIDVKTPIRWLAGIIGTPVAVIAVHCETSGTFPRFALIGQ